ncbi:MAG: oxidoreductase [Gemmataceae bacterium]
MSETRQGTTPTRREFLGTTATVVGALATAAGGLPAVHAAGSDVIRVGLIGCGGRGMGAAENVLQAARGVKIVALADYFKNDEGRGVEPCRQRLIRFAQEDQTVRELGNSVDIPPERCFTGLDAYKHVLNAGVDYVILATPPGFRPYHLQAAVEAGKHIFTEKPVCVDGPGARLCLQVYEKALEKKLGIAAGTQRRHQLGYIETIKRIHDGAIGRIVAARCYWNQGHIWFRPRQQGMSDLDYQIHNWYHFLWLSGDHIVEQHVHNLDVINWATGQRPERAVGMGGRVRPCKDPAEDGNIYNFFAVDYEYPHGLHVLSMCRQINNCEGNVSEALVGTQGTCQVNQFVINGKPVIDRQQARRATNPYVQEHTDLIESIRAGKPINELKNVTESSLTVVMGRMAAYTGKAVTWEQALNSQQNLVPERITAAPPVTPVPVPGQTPLV